MLTLSIACGPTLPPTTVPAQPDPTFEPFKAALQAYVDQTQPFRKQAAVASEKVPGKAAPTPSAEASVRTRQNELADALRTKLRPNAKPGDVFTAQIAPAVRHQLENAFSGAKRALLLDDLAEQNETPPEGAPKINERIVAPRVPPRLMELLPPLPKQLEYDFAGRTLILRDVDADVVVDYLADALPALTRNAPAASQPAAVHAPSGSALMMPQVRGGTVFAIMGDSGSGDLPQQQVANAMLSYFENVRRFGFVLMLGDNLYGDDYTNEFLVPYKALLDRGVKFYAAIGNHDRDLEIHFKPFNMGDKDHYSFEEGNARFAVLNSNHPTDPEQLKWLNSVFADSGTKWRIAFFHHPLYSSGQHASESRDVIRPALEQTLVKAGVHVVFSGHEHLYERIKPQQGITYFVSGGGGRYLYKVRPSEFDDVAVSAHHFMVAEIAGDRLFFQALSHEQKVIDCGVLFRASNIKADDDTDKFQAACDAARARPVTTAQR